MGRYIEDFDQLDKQLGALVREWGILELHLAALFGALVGPNTERHISLFYAIVSNQARAELMRKALVFSGFPAARRKKVESIIAKFQKLNSPRNRYIHGLYAKAEDRIVRMDFTTPERFKNATVTHGGRSDLNASEIVNHVAAVHALARQVQDFLRENGMLPEGWQ